VPPPRARGGRRPGGSRGISLHWALVSDVAVIASGFAAWADTAGEVPEIFKGYLEGYLPRTAVPDSRAILPPAPELRSATQTRDDVVARTSRRLTGTLRWRQAAVDADLHFPAAAGAFACALRVDISQKTTPRLYLLLRRSLTDAGLSTYPAKEAYRRPRPFVARRGGICTPTDAKGLSADGSYPSGHAAIGWAWALILAEAAPDRADQILARGRTFMQSRVVCNVHWQSDIEAGATMGAAVVARLHDEPLFLADLQAARAEITAARAAGESPTRDCPAEAAALASAPADLP
jgi:acid phosphatase (class A)